MGNRSRFVRPAVVTLTLTNGDTLTVKRRLNAGEERAYFARLYRQTDDGTLRVNPIAVGVALVEAYLVDWTLRDDDDRPVVIRGQPVETLRAILDDLDPLDMREIRTAIEEHAQRVDDERVAEKNAQGGETASSAISPSRSVVVGATNGLPN